MHIGVSEGRPDATVAALPSARGREDSGARKGGPESVSFAGQAEASTVCCYDHYLALAVYGFTAICSRPSS